MMNKKSLYYYLGALLIVLGCVGYYILGNVEVMLILALFGIVLVLLSNKNWWLKILTICIPSANPIIAVKLERHSFAVAVSVAGL